MLLRGGGKTMGEDQIRAETEHEKRAREILKQGSPTPEELTALRGLERQVAASGNDALAREVRSLRIAKDKARAIAILSGADSRPDEMLRLAKRLAEYKEVGYARRLLVLVRSNLSMTECPSIYLEIFQKSALYTYKDPDLPAEWRLDKALEILEEAAALDTTTIPETLGLVGAIYKRKWEVDGQRRNLESSLSHYLKGYAQGAPDGERSDVLQYLRKNRDIRLRAEDDRGYCGINAAFMLDLLAQEEEKEAKRLGLSATAAALRREDARLIRAEIVRSVPPLREAKDGEWLREEWWFYATIGEAFFGLKRFDEAIRWLVAEPAAAGLKVGFEHGAPAGLEVPEWEYESTARQLARLARLQQDVDMSEEEFEQTDAGQTLKHFLKEDDRAVRSAFRGKFGLGLSGGGFRAALFHIGVLAHLAERDLLRHVEVLSCVSGGSIVGAYYYLKLRHLLETKTDDEIAPDDYVHIVQDVEKDFLKGVQRNIRTRVLAEFTTNLKMIFVPGYSRTLRIGELYERELFSRVEDGEPRERWLDAIFIHPLLSPGKKQTDFHPRNHNWRRKNKVPTLIINAASLNTGHNWQFTASYMGEPPTPINAEIDCNDRLRRMYFTDPPKKKFRLGHAVAASSCVPGLFEPLLLDGLYPDRSVRLVDGGVCDNQGIRSLLEQDCTVLEVSDGSGQMETQLVPSRGVLGVPLRSNSILMARVREAQYEDVKARSQSLLLPGLLFVHLKQDLPGAAIAWNDCPPYRSESDFERKVGKRNRTRYDIDISIQKRLAGIRTDLDSFNDAEAYALMASGYRITADQLNASSTGIAARRPPRQAEWEFLRISRDLEPEGPNRSQLEQLLAAGSNSAFKIWRLCRPLIVLKWVIAGAATLAAALALWQWRATSLTLGQISAMVLSIIFFALLAVIIRGVAGARTGRYVLRLIQPRETARDIAVGIGMSVVGFLVARLHLLVFDRLYLWYGRIERFQGKAPG
jgi:predicted acylesterase/phospholipase RssA